jgi:hypothetical protein
VVFAAYGLYEQFGKGVMLKLATKKRHELFQDQERLLASANGSECVSWPLVIGERGIDRGRCQM